MKPFRFVIRWIRYDLRLNTIFPMAATDKLARVAQARSRNGAAEAPIPGNVTKALLDLEFLYHRIHYLLVHQRNLLISETKFNPDEPPGLLSSFWLCSSPTGT